MMLDGVNSCKFSQILAERAGLLAIAVNPNGTSQNCSGCGAKVPKELKDRTHACPKCGLTLERDHNAAINIKYLAVGHSVNKAQVTSDAIAGVTLVARSVCVSISSREYVTTDKSASQSNIESPSVLEESGGGGFIIQ